MQVAEQKEHRATIVRELNFETIDETNCFQIREKLDALFGGGFMLEETHADFKRILFEHLESCQMCCRSFDVRVRFRSAKRDTIY